MTSAADFHDPCPEGGEGVVDLGSGVRLKFTTRGEWGERIGILESHPTPRGGRCAGTVIFDVPGAAGLEGPRWQVHSWEPLTITPSVHCLSCGHHGWIRDGVWVPA